MEVLNDLIEAGIGQKHLNELVEEKEFPCLDKHTQKKACNLACTASHVKIKLLQSEPMTLPLESGPCRSCGDLTCVLFAIIL